MQYTDPFIINIIIFVLAIFVGYFVVWSVTPALHTPLMSVTNAISGIIIIGSLTLIVLNKEEQQMKFLLFFSLDKSSIVAYLANILASINIFGGFVVTMRMLSMYKKKK